MIVEERPAQLAERPVERVTLAADRGRSWWPFALLAGSLAGLFAPVFVEVGKVWFTDEYATHCALVPLMAGLLVWWKRRELASVVRRPSAWGFVPLGLGLALEMIAWYARIRVFEALSIVPILVGITLLTAGPAALRILRFPILFLAFMAPLPRYLILPISFPIQVISARAACWGAQQSGIALSEEGFNVVLPRVTVEVEESCSGFKKALTLIVFAAFYASLFCVPFWRQIALVALALPVAVLANIVRVYALIVAGAWSGEAAVHLLHDVSSLIVLGLCYVMLTALGKALGCRRVRYTASPQPR